MLVSSDILDHPRMVAIPRRRRRTAREALVTGGSWAGMHRTNGFVSTVAVRELDIRAGTATVVEFGLWLRAPGGYRFDCPELFSWRDSERALIPAELRRAIYERDGYACLHCGSTETLSLDHIHPWSAGGSDTYENLQTLCRLCNSRKGARYAP